MKWYQDKGYWQELLWIMALVLPWGIGGYVVHTAASISTGIMIYWGMGLLVPALVFGIRKSGYGSEWGLKRSAAHLPLWISTALIQMCVFWNYMPRINQAYKAQPVVVDICFFLVTAFSMWLVNFLDNHLPGWYVAIAQKGERWRLWAGSIYFTGLIPAASICSFLLLYYVGGMHLDPMTSVFFVMEMMTFTFYGKILLAMMTFSFYLYFALEGTRGQRLTRCAFSAIFWFILAYIPVVISLRLPGNGSWRAIFDPSYLSMFPILSDMWLNGLALFFGEKITKWIFKQGE